MKAKARSWPPSARAGPQLRRPRVPLASLGREAPELGLCSGASPPRCRRSSDLPLALTMAWGESEYVHSAPRMDSEKHRSRDRKSELIFLVPWSSTWGPPLPLTMPLPKYFSILSRVVGGVLASRSARNCNPYSRSRIHRPCALTHSPALAAGNEPTTVTKSRCPLALTWRTAKPLSSLKKVTRSINPDRLSANGDKGWGGKTLKSLE